MENENLDNSNFIQKIYNSFKVYKNYIFTFIFALLIIIISLFFLNYIKDKKNEEVSENYIKAGVHFTSGEKEKSKKIYKDVVNSKNEFYSVLALNSIIENNLEEDNEEILKLFKIVEGLKMDKEQKNLIKLKKALFMIKISQYEEGKKLLNEIVSSNSIWKEAALQILE